jgi:hypothetical protein
MFRHIYIYIYIYIYVDVPTDSGIVLSHRAIYRTLIYVVLIATCNKTVTELMDCACCLLMKLLAVSFTASIKLRNLAAVKPHDQPSSLAL